MQSFQQHSPLLTSVPIATAGRLTTIANSAGRERLYRDQAPQVLERLAARTRFDSITASSAIENVVLDDERALRVVRGGEPGPYSDRDESEFAGYRDAVDFLLGKQPERLTIPLLLHLHRLLMRNTDDPTAGALKTNDNFIGTDPEEGPRQIIFETVPAGTPTERNLDELIGRYEEAVAEGRAPTLLLVAMLVLDMLAIHPFAEGNGRVARLLTTQELVRHGYGVARYVSLEQRIFDSKNSYYVALRHSQSGWHDGTHDVMPWIDYLLKVIEDAYVDFERRVAAGTQLVGATKREQARNYVLTQAPSRFRLAQIELALGDISVQTIRAALNELRDEGFYSVGVGRGAMWERTPKPMP